MEVVERGEEHVEQGEDAVAVGREPRDRAVVDEVVAEDLLRDGDVVAPGLVFLDEPTDDGGRGLGHGMTPFVATT